MAKCNENAIREAAYYIWQNAGCPLGNDEYFWAMAVEQLNGSCKNTKTSLAPVKKAPVKKSPAKKTKK